MYDVIVVGVGAMGSAAAYHLARRGQRVLALERFDIPHAMGSSHGETRIIRLPYYEDASYVPLLHRAFELWEDLESWAGERLLVRTGSIDAGPEDGWVFGGSLRSCEEHGLEHEVLTSSELSRRHPGYQLDGASLALWQPQGGFLLPERSIVSHVQRAHSHGAEIHARERVTALDWSGGTVRVTTDRQRYEAGRLVLTAGAWMAGFVPELAGIAVPQRQALGWFQPREPALFTPETFPVFNLEEPDKVGRWYGFPAFAIPGFKIGRYRHLEEDLADPDTLDREPNAKDEALLRYAVERYFPAANGPTMSLRTCMFTNTEDGHFVIDTLPDAPQVVIASPCSGHGFKFASVIGELLADLVIDGTSRLQQPLFGLARLTMN